MTPSKQAMGPLTLEQLDALETYNAGVKMGAHGQGADRSTTLRLIAMARESIAAQPGAEDDKDRLLDAYKLEAKAAYDLLTLVSVPTSTMGPWNRYISAKKDRKRMEDEG